MTTLASARDRNHSRLRHSSRNLPLKLSVAPFLPGLAGIDQRGIDLLVAVFSCGIGLLAESMRFRVAISDRIPELR